MAIFERFRRQAGSGFEAARNDAFRSAAQAEAADAAVGNSNRHAAYEKARLAELLPDLREEARLEMELKAAASSLSRARQLKELSQTALQLLRKARADGSRFEEAVNKDAEAAEEFALRERRHSAAAQALDDLKTKITEHDAALRVRFGLE